MRQLDALLIWMGIVVFALIALVFSFYVASVLLPIILAIIIFSALFNLGTNFYRNFKKVRKVEIYSPRQDKKSEANIIDAEYEIIDDKKK